MKKCYRESRKRGISFIATTGRKVNVSGHILHRNFLVKHVIESKDRSEVKTRKNT